MRWNSALLVAAIAVVNPAFAQDSKAWLEAQNLGAKSSKGYEEFEVLVAFTKGTPADERVVVFKQGKPMWQSNPKETDPGSRWTVHSIGRDLDGNGQPDVHFSSHTGGANCCTTHHVYQLKPQVKRLVAYSAGSMGGGDFIEVPGRKSAIMVSADDSPANAFAPYANSYFPLVILEVGPKGRLQFARDLMQSKLPGQPPPVCTQPPATSNPWLKERCAEYSTSRRHARTNEIKQRLSSIKSQRSADKLKWEDYFENGVLAAVSAEINRYTYTGHGGAAGNWLEMVWPGNDAVKSKFITTLRQTQAKSVFAEDLKGLASDYR